MRIRDTLLALTATVVAGSAIAVAATPAAAQNFYRPGFERGYPAAYGGYYHAPRPWFEHPHYGWGYPASYYGYGYGFHPHYRPYWR